METILITNIGNRNLKYKGSEINKYLEELQKSHGAEKATFLDFTERLLLDYETEKENLSLKLLPAGLDFLKKENQIPSKILLLGSKQSNTRNDQDTVHAASLCRNLLKDQYGFLDSAIEVIPFKARVTDNESSFSNYSGLFRQLIAKYPTSNLIFCNAGGTGQMKNAAIALLQFLLPASQFKSLDIQRGKDDNESIAHWGNIDPLVELISAIRLKNFWKEVNTMHVQRWQVKCQD